MLGYNRLTPKQTLCGVLIDAIWRLVVICCTTTCVHGMWIRMHVRGKLGADVRYSIWSDHQVRDHCMESIIRVAITVWSRPPGSRPLHGVDHQDRDHCIKSTAMIATTHKVDHQVRDHCIKSTTMIAIIACGARVRFSVRVDRRRICVC